MTATGEFLTRAPRAAAGVPAAERSSHRRWIVAGLVVAAFAAEVAAILVTTKGHFTYTLDDPYIHLALADHIRQGHYGINAGEASSPSSSMLWPFLLSLTAGAPFQDWMPLLWNLLFTVISALLIHETFSTHLRRGALAATAGCLLALNIVGVAFTGLEHSLQVAVTLAVARGVVRAAMAPTAGRLLPVAIAVGPLVRYENVGFSVAAALVLWLTGHRRPALFATATWMAGLGAFSAFLVSRGLDLLPSSVLAKSGYAHGSSWEVLVMWRSSLLLGHPLVLVCVLVVLADAAVLKRWTVLHTFAIFVIGCHAVAGDFGWMGRYEVYLLAGLVPVLVSLVADWTLVWTRALRAGSAILAALALIAVMPLAVCTVQAPSAAADIWHRQGQTARFVHDFWRRPIAVNDLGLVAYRGGQPVLDLWGLASQEARRLRLQDRGRWVGPLVARRGVQAAAVYNVWFTGQIPSRWTPVGTLDVGGVPEKDFWTVTFYATGPRALEPVCGAFRRFAASDSAADTTVSHVCLR